MNGKTCVKLIILNFAAILFFAFGQPQSAANAQSKTEPRESQSSTSDQLELQKKRLNHAALAHGKLDFFRFLRKHEFSSRLKFSSSQTHALSKLRKEYREQMRKHVVPDGVDSYTRMMTTLDEQSRLLVDLYKKYRDEHLTAAQKKMLDKLVLHHRMSLAKPFEEYIDKRVASAIGLTPTQREQIAIKAVESCTQLKQFKIEKVNKWLRELRAKLTDEQLKKLDQMLGEAPTHELINDR